jgi:hypothetical protein
MKTIHRENLGLLPVNFVAADIRSLHLSTLDFSARIPISYRFYTDFGFTALLGIAAKKERHSPKIPPAGESYHSYVVENKISTA